MASFDKAIDVVLEHEGHLEVDAADRGGATNYGLSLRFLRNMKLDINGDGIVDENDILRMSQDDAIEIYRADLWLPAYERIKSQGVATKVFDMAVNMGAHQAHVLLQRALCSFDIALTVDGIIGDKTLAAINDTPEDMILWRLCDFEETFYCTLADNNPINRKWLKGWLKRAEWGKPEQEPDWRGYEQSVRARRLAVRPAEAEDTET